MTTTTPTTKDSTLQDRAIYIVGAGAQTPVGRSVLTAAAAVRCGICAYAEHPYMINKEGESMVVARARWLGDDLPLEDRIVTLATDAAIEGLDPLTSKRPSVHCRMRIHFALSAENLPDPIQRQRIVDRIVTGTRFSTPSLAIEPIVDGHAGGLLALESAVHEIQHDEAQLCLVVGADSWIAPERLNAIDRAGCVHSTSNSWGFTPGEGAGCCLITTGAVARRFGLSPLAELAAVATARETKLMGTEAVCTGEGLTAAFRGVLSRGPRVAHSYCDLNGETYRADEYGFTVCRMSDCFENAGSFTAAAECWGDVGAASGPLLLTLPLAAWKRNYDKGPVALTWSSSAQRSLRGAALLRRFAAATQSHARYHQH